MRQLARPVCEPAPAAPACDFTAHAALVARPPGRVRRDDVAAAVRSLDEVRSSPQVLAELTRRALVLAGSGTPVDAVTARARAVQESEDDVTRLIIEERLLAGVIPDGPTGDIVRARVREQRIDHVESLVRELSRRVGARIDLDEAEEWRAWANLRAACDLVRSDDAERMDREVLFQIVFHPLTNHAVRLANIRTRRILAGDMFRFLADLGREAESSKNHDLLHRNVRACDADRLPSQALLPGDPLHDPAATARVLHRCAIVFGMALTALALVAIAMGVLAVDADEPRSGFHPAWLVMLVVSCVLATWTYRRLRRIVQASLTDDGLVVQTRHGRYHVEARDVRSVRVVHGGRIVFHLRRVPSWLRRRLFVVATSPEAALAIGQRIDAWRK
jgi:hypothetical protein